MRVALGIEYDGNNYHGWQQQPGLSTVQHSVEAALGRVAAHPIEIYAAGRTDTGVHATAQVVHFDTTVQRSIKSWIFGTNSYLPKDIVVRWARVVPEHFHARYSAKARRYLYFIYNHSIRSSLLHGRCTWNFRHLDHHRMAQAAEHLVGEHDFSSFRAIDCQSKTPVREIFHLRVSRIGDIIVLDLAANAFLHHMVRNIAGVLMQVGAGTREIDWVPELLQARNRAMGSETAPAYGLYLTQVCYPEYPDIPQDFIKPIWFQG
jgi:tRNA pseudouridine38-40 synthase